MYTWGLYPKELDLNSLHEKTQFELTTWKNLIWTNPLQILNICHLFFSWCYIYSYSFNQTKLTSQVYVLYSFSLQMNSFNSCISTSKLLLLLSFVSMSDFWLSIVLRLRTSALRLHTKWTTLLLHLENDNCHLTSM